MVRFYHAVITIFLINYFLTYKALDLKNINSQKQTICPIKNIFHFENKNQY